MHTYKMKKKKKNHNNPFVSQKSKWTLETNLKCFFIVHASVDRQNQQSSNLEVIFHRVSFRIFLNLLCTEQHIPLHLSRPGSPSLHHTHGCTSHTPGRLYMAWNLCGTSVGMIWDPVHWWGLAREKTMHLMVYDNTQFALYPPLSCRLTGRSRIGWLTQLLIWAVRTVGATVTHFHPGDTSPSVTAQEVVWWAGRKGANLRSRRRQYRKSVAKIAT